MDPTGLCKERLRLYEANRYFREGEGEPLYVKASSIRISGVYSSDFNSKGDTMVYRTKIISNNNDFLTYGNITLKYEGNNQISILPDNYGFEMHKGRFFRNIETIIGHAIAGNGTPYDITFVGNVNINPN
jgi:hypothetical protein